MATMIFFVLVLYVPFLIWFQFIFHSESFLLLFEKNFEIEFGCFLVCCFWNLSTFYALVVMHWCLAHVFFQAHQLTPTSYTVLQAKEEVYPVILDFLIKCDNAKVDSGS